MSRVMPFARIGMKLTNRFHGSGSAKVCAIPLGITEDDVRKAIDYDIADEHPGRFQSRFKNRRRSSERPVAIPILMSDFFVAELNKTGSRIAPKVDIETVQRRPPLGMLQRSLSDAVFATDPRLQGQPGVGPQLSLGPEPMRCLKQGDNSAESEGKTLPMTPRCFNPH